MPEKHLYEYAVIRVVPQVEREEFINVGVILFCKKQRYLALRYVIDSSKLTALSSTIDIEEVKAYLLAMERICNGTDKNSPIAALDIPSRFRWLTATRSSIIQTSKVHPGLSCDLEGTLGRLVGCLVL